ncbi:MAG TPA: diacylglycerol kinase family protein [Nocardioidaceae bacterium]|nr:diacylglycerol kinase family protein [Nocardioidaceae bacterium]
MWPPAPGEGQARQRWLARAAVLLVCLSVALLLGFAVQRNLWLLLVAILAVVVVVGSTYGFLAHRGAWRLLALALLVATPVALIWLYARQDLLWLVLGLLLAAGLAVVTGRAALDSGSDEAAMPEYDAPTPRRPFIVMNPRSGGGKVGRFHLKKRAEDLGAEVFLLDRPGVDVAAVARNAVARGADLLGVAGGDGTQALVAGVAAELDVPFMVVSAGTRNHFALDLGLDREDPSTCLAALTEDAVELRVDLGVVAGRTFVNNASFGAYAAVVQSPAYRDDKTRTTLALLPDLLTGHTGPRLTAHADGVTVDHPQAVLVSDNPYGRGDVAGMGRRVRLDTGVLGVVAVTADNTIQAVGLLRRSTESGLTVLKVPEVVVTADAAQIPVGVDGEAVVLPTPVHCAIRPGALRVRVPRSRPGVPARRASWDLRELVRLALSRVGDEP